MSYIYDFCDTHRPFVAKAEKLFKLNTVLVDYFKEK